MNRMYIRSNNIRFKQPFAQVQMNGVKECTNECKVELGCIGFSVKKAGGFCMLTSYSSEVKDMIDRDYDFDSYDRA